MDILTLISYCIFAIVFSLLMLELGAAILLLYNYKSFKQRLSAYVAPIWEITGTFTVFYLISFEAFFPKLLTAIGTLYILPVLLALIFIIIRDAFLAYSEYVNDKVSELFYSRIYGISTIIALILVITVLDSSISGAGVNLQTLTPNYFVMLFNPFNILMLVSLISLVVFASSIFFDIRDYRIIPIALIVFILSFVIAISVYVPYIAANMINELYLIVPALALLFTILILYVIEHKHARYFVLPMLFIIIFTFEILEYPMLFGGTAILTNYATQPINDIFLAFFTAIGGAFLGVALVYFVYVQHLHRASKRKVSK